MKLTKIAKLCKESRHICIFESEEREIQWVGNNYAAYPMYRAPRMDKTGALAVFDISEDKEEAFTVNITAFPDGMSFTDNDPRENPLEKYGFTIAGNSGIMQPVRTQRGLMLFNPKYLDPVLDDKVELYERISDDGTPYIAAKAGFMIMGIIMPVWPKDGKLAKELLEVATMYAEAAERLAEEV